MPAIVIFGGLACGTLLAAVGLALWDVFHQVDGLPQAIRVIGWLAGGLLLTGAALAWRRDHSLVAPTLRLVLMAALAAPPRVHRPPHPSWSSLMPIVPALVLTGAGLCQAAGPVGTGTASPPVGAAELAAIHLPAVIRSLAIIICGGVGARALGEALSALIIPTSQFEGPVALTYALLTLLASGAVLVNLWQRGAMWRGTAGESGLAGAWLAWSAAWLGPRQRPRLRAALIVVAALWLIVVAAGYSEGA